MRRWWAAVFLGLSVGQTEPLAPSPPERAGVRNAHPIATRLENPDTNWEIPALEPEDEVLVYTGFRLVYHEAHEQAKWVAYHLLPGETQKTTERTDRFLPDPRIRTGSAEDADYRGSGYDRGHLAPAADMAWSEVSMAESFYYSNMSPQLPACNRGIWKRAEDQVRKWARAGSGLFVATGPVLRRGLPTIGPNRVSVPELYFKAVLDTSGGEAKALAFLIPNAGSPAPVSDYAVSIDSAESATGLDFFPGLPDRLEKQVESRLCRECWAWRSTGRRSK